MKDIIMLIEPKLKSRIENITNRKWKDVKVVVFGLNEVTVYFKEYGVYSTIKYSELNV